MFFNSLGKKEAKSIKVIRKGIKEIPPKDIAVAWTGGKDSTLTLYLIKKAFGGKIPFKVFFNDSTMEFPQVYDFIKKLKKDWNLDLITFKHSKKELKEFKEASWDEQKTLSRLMKINAIKRVLKKHKFKAFIVSIRWDEHESRSKEKYLVKKKNHLRVHPILHFSEKDVWKYTKKENIPYVSLYDEGYRSLGEMPFTGKAKKGKGERSGREYDKEKVMARLRALGYW
jgi:phosphoadenosine phosphosulfate reductase